MQIIVSDDKKERIDKYLTKYIDESRSTISKMIDASYILVNNEEVNSHYQVRKNDVIDITEGFKEELHVDPENIPLNIVYEDDDIIVVNKESGMVVHPGAGNFHGTLANAIKYHTDHLSDVNGELRPGIVHRIDKDTSGLMIVAKNNKAHEILADMLSRHEIKRDYIALVHGEIKNDSGTIDAPIGRSETEWKKMAVTSHNSKNAITHFKVLKKYKDYTLIRLSLETGRTHQIRVHMAYIGYPIVNDPLYSHDKCSSFGQFLHSYTLDFIHPITKKQMHFEAPLPDYFTDYLKKLEEL